MQGVDFSAAMQPNAEAILRFIGELGKLGIRAITVEGISPVGIGRFGLNDNMTDKRAADYAVAGQNDWSWWVGHEDMLVDTEPMLVPHPARSREELEAQYFRMLANRALPMLPAVYPTWPDDLRRGAYYYHTFNTLQPCMSVAGCSPTIAASVGAARLELHYSLTGLSLFRSPMAPAWSESMERNVCRSTPAKSCRRNLIPFTAFFQRRDHQGHARGDRMMLRVMITSLPASPLRSRAGVDNI